MGSKNIQNKMPAPRDLQVADDFGPGLKGHYGAREMNRKLSAKLKEMGQKTHPWRDGNRRK